MADAARYVQNFESLGRKPAYMKSDGLGFS